MRFCRSRRWRRRAASPSAAACLGRFEAHIRCTLMSENSRIPLYVSWLTQMHAEKVTLRDAMAYQELNVRTARMALQERTSIIVERDIAKRVTANKRRDADQLRMARQLRADRMDAAVEEVREAHHQEQLLDRYLGQVSRSLRESLQRHSVQTHHDLQHVMLEHARISGVYEKRVLEMLGLFDMDLSAAAQEAQKAAMQKANVKRKMTPAQAAAARVVRGEQAKEENEATKSPKDGEEEHPQAEDAAPTTQDQRKPSDDEPGPSTEEHGEASHVHPEPEPSPWADEIPKETSIPSDPTADVWASDGWGVDARAPVEAPPATEDWSSRAEEPPESLHPQETPPQNDSQPPAQTQSTLFQSRLSSGRRFGGLSASDAARSLAGTF